MFNVLFFIYYIPYKIKGKITYEMEMYDEQCCFATRTL